MNETLKMLRKENKLSSAVVAKKVGAHRDTLRKVENGISQMPSNWIPTLAKLYKREKLSILNIYLREEEKRNVG